MKKSSLLLLLLGFILFISEANSQTVYNKEGFYAGISFMGTAWSIEDSDAEGGAGIGLKIGYNFNPNFGIFLGLDGSAIDPDNGDAYGLGHFDLGAEYTFRTLTDRVRPFISGALTAMAAVDEDEDFEMTGGGITLGGGAFIYGTQNLAIRFGLDYSFINLTEIKVGSQTETIDLDANSARVSIGLLYNF